ncbi:MAG: hypothetical protein V5A68_03235 [Candidatus Thermoplasmatota archaeon]
MKNKFVSTCILFFLLFCLLSPSVFSVKNGVDSYSSEDSEEYNQVKIDFCRYEIQSQIVNDNFSKDIDYEKVNLILNELLEIEDNFSGLIKIRKQINILQENDIISDYFSVDKLMQYQKEFNFLKFRIKSLFGGPFIISHLTLGNRIKNIIPFWQPIFYETICNANRIKGVAGIIPCFCGYTTSPVFVSVTDLSNSEFFGDLYSNFFEIMLPCMGFSLGFYANNQNILFEYNLDLCYFGIFVTHNSF